MCTEPRSTCMKRRKELERRKQCYEIIIHSYEYQSSQGSKTSVNLDEAIKIEFRLVPKIATYKMKLANISKELKEIEHLL